MDKDIEAWLAERDAALASLDMDYARRMMPDAEDDVRLAAMHKARYECTGLAAELRHASGHWLRERELGRMTFAPLLPEGELP